MIIHHSFHKSMDSIGSYRQALDYRKEALDIPLDMLSICVPEEIIPAIKQQNFGAGIFSMDRILPDAFITSSDKFFIKDKSGEMKQVTPEPGMDPTKLYYQPNLPLQQGKLQKLYPLSSYYGNFVTLSRSMHACRRALAVHALFLYLKELGLYEVYQDIRLPSLDALIPGLNYGNWKNHKTSEIIKNLTKVSQEIPSVLNVLSGQQEEILVDDDEYDPEVLRVIGPRINTLVSSFSDFYEFDRDCFYRLELQQNHVRLIKGVDHKFLPYYEQKYGTSS